MSKGLADSQVPDLLKLDVEGTGQAFGNLRYEAGPGKTGSSHRPGEEVEEQGADMAFTV